MLACNMTDSTGRKLKYTFVLIETYSQQLMPPHHFRYVLTSSAEALNRRSESTIDIN